jgi:membrane-bound serine protease (ClpP class)
MCLKTLRLVAIFLFCWPLLLVASPDLQEIKPSSGAAVVPVEGVFKPLLVTTVKRRTEQAIASGANVIVYRVKSDGGQLGAAMELSNYVFGLSDNLTTLAYVDDKAYSAAALFSLACDQLIMEPGSAIGDCEPIMPTQGGYTTAGEKIQSPLKERFRSYAKKNGYPVLLAQAMVSSQLKILKAYHSGNQQRLYRSEDWEMLSEEQQQAYSEVKIICHEGDLLTLSDGEALEHGFSRGTYANIDDYLNEAGLTPVENVMEMNSTEQLVDLIDVYTPILLAIGIFFIYMEIKTPGVGIFGALGAVAFAVFFMGKFYQGQAGYLELMLFVLGFGLIALEIFVFPGFGVAGLAGLLMLVCGLVLAMQDFSVPVDKGQWLLVLDNLATVCLSFLLATLGFVILMIFLPKGEAKLSFWHGLFQRHKQTPTPKISSQTPEMQPLLGCQGSTTTVLMPAGKALFEGQIYSVCSESGPIEAGEPVEVTSQEGMQLMVKAISTSSSTDSQS